MKQTTPDLFSVYFDLVRETEPPLIFHRWSLISCISALLGQNCWMPFGAFRILPNQYIMLIGESGSRKSTAIKLARKMLAKSGYKNFAADKTSKEKFLLDLEGLEEVNGNTQVMENLFGDGSNDSPRELFIVADEFNDFMRHKDTEFHSMLGKLWDWDDEDLRYKQRLKNSKEVEIYQPTINLLGGNTHENFAEMFPATSLGQGFLSRLLLIFSEPSNIKIASPPALIPEKVEHFIGMLHKIRDSMHGTIPVTDRAKEVLKVLYNSYEGFPDLRFTSYFTRRYSHLLKLCIICTAAKQKACIGIEEVILANTILRYTEHFMPKALGEFGKAKNADVANKILTLLSKTYKPIDQPDIWKQVNQDLDRQEDLTKLLDGLRMAGKIQWVKKTANGAVGYLIVRKALGINELYTNYELLKEYESAKIN